MGWRASRGCTRQVARTAHPERAPSGKQEACAWRRAPARAFSLSPWVAGQRRPLGAPSPRPRQQVPWRRERRMPSVCRTVTDRPPIAEPTARTEPASPSAAAVSAPASSIAAEAWPARGGRLHHHRFSSVGAEAEVSARLGSAARSVGSAPPTATPFACAHSSQSGPKSSPGCGVRSLPLPHVRS